ncbi:Gfo/Idh/MocA family protein [Geofilum rubicundum]|uniref:Oxidoreductase n=1 Tax=Geofilum rubicundum JCM 15548 TaxID=1236989 RepID=A0A0E9LUB2_9BACT|nr:Gfo/Idh/MocA family oxidoreductase [Geofilum rubicundum]GAO28731.1 oxidoreductase [Geofilum rubicundum JCM 15548]
MATPPSTHAEYAIKAMRAGKAVYVEKPMAATYAQCQEMIRVSDETGVPLFVAYYRRSLPGFLKVKELVEEGHVGTPLMANIRLTRPPLPQEMDGEAPIWRVDPKVAGGGIFYDLASHQLDFLSFVFGDLTDIHGFATNGGKIYPAEDTVTAVFQFKNGLTGTGTWSFVTDPSAREDVMEIIGTKGKIVFSGFGHEPVMLYNEKGELEFPYMNPENIQYNMIKQVVQELLHHKPCVSSAHSAAKVNWAMEKVVYGT